MKNALQALLQEHEVDALLVTHIPHIRWACGFTGSRGLLIVRTDKSCFLSDTRYTEQAHSEIKGIDVFVQQGAFHEVVKRKNLLEGSRRVLYPADSMTVTEFAKWRAALPFVEWVPGEQLLTKAVACKTEAEIACLRQAQKITDSVFESILGSIEPGVREQELAAEIVYQHLRRGAESMSFDPIVASGPRGALPHGRPSDRRLQTGDLVLLDFGCFLHGYASDMTRTVALGDVGEEARKTYSVVLDAQKHAIEQTHAGLSTSEADTIARKVICNAGYGDYFVHSLGHGIGLEIHEWPRIAQQTNDVLPPQVVVTIEPGIYLPGQFGIRIEDAVIVSTDGCERLGTSTRELIVL